MLKQILYLIILALLISSCKKDPSTNGVLANTIKDVDGNEYHYVSIGTQTWMLENLKVTRFSNGDIIPFIPNNSGLTQLAFIGLRYYNDEVNNKNSYGCLYNWNVIKDSRGICPNGWHVPTNDEWKVLLNYLGGEEYAGAKLKEVGNIHWSSPNYASNYSNFRALPGGAWGNTFNNIGTTGYWWTSTENSQFGAYYWWITSNSTFCSWGSYIKTNALSIRCIKD